MTRFCSCSGNLASMLEISRKGKQLTKALCGTCGGRPLVDGIEPKPASMLSTVDLELTNFINSDLKWTKVKKGCRSANRRSRKLITSSLNVGVELGNMSCKRDLDSSVSESEKFGVAVLGRRFAEKEVAGVPIKKRRYLIQSPSPPSQTLSLDHKEFLHQTQTPHPEESEQLVDSKLAAAGRRCSQDLHSDGKKRAFNKSEVLKFTQCVDGVRNGKKSKVTNGVCDYDDDFSGIQLLAAAACSSSIDDDAVNIKEKSVMEGSAKAEAIDSTGAAIPFKESIASSGTGNFSEKDLLNEDDMGDSFVDGSAISVSVNLNEIEHGGMVKNRAHWDLNTVMEAWEEPSDDPLVNSNKINNPKYVVNDGLQCEKFALESCEMQRNLEDAQCDIERPAQSVVCKKVSLDLEDNQILVDPNCMVVAPARSCLQEDKLEACSSPKGTSIEEKYVTTATESVPEPLNYAVAHRIASTPVMNMEASRDYWCPGSHHTVSSHVFEGKTNTSPSDLEQMGEDSSGTSVAENIKLLSGSSQAGKLNKSASEIDGTQTKDSEDFEKTHGLPGCRTSPRQVSTPTCKTLDVGNSVGESDKADCFHPSPNGEALSASSTSVAIVEVKRQVDPASATDNTVNDFALQIGPMELMVKSTNCLGKLGPENNFSDCYGSYATGVGHMAGVGHMTEYDAGYDSSFEDGELREPGVYSWEENEVGEGETECVDYGSDYGDGDDFDAVDYSLSENLETGRDGYQISKKEVSLAKNDDIEKIGIVGNRSGVDGESVKFLQQCFKGDQLKGRSSSLSLKEKNSGADQFNEHLESGNAEGNVDGHADKGLLAEEFGSRAIRENLSSYSKGFDALERKNMHPAQRSRYENSQYSYLRADRDFGIEKFAGRDKFSIKACGRNEADGHWVDSAAGYRETRNRYSHSYHGSEGNGYSRPRDVIANSGAKVGEMKSHGDKRSINYSSNGMYRPIIRRRPPTDRDDSYGVQRGISPVRGIGQNRSRGRSGPYAQGISRGPKDYPEDLPDDAAVPTVRRQQYFVRRERGFSPNYRPRTNSCSSSRTRSPVSWRDRNVGARRRSPDLRSDARMERMRSPFQKPSFTGDNEEIFMSPPRGRLSPQNNSRWFDNGNYMDNHFKDRRSPVRMFRRSQRFDSVGYSGRLKSDGFFRPISHRGRFHQASGTGRGRDFEGSDDEKRKHDRYEMSHRVRRYDAGGAVRRFRYDTEDCFEACNSQNDNESFRGAIKRDIPRSGAGEDRGQRYNSDRMYASASSSGQRDFNDNAAVREEGPHDL